ncbi:hypothetical protein VD0001_g2661 [Verticillium dahliae]|nr:hypothetical protein VD0001_g2661 [Verticillium dahliae]
MKQSHHLGWPRVPVHQFNMALNIGRLSFEHHHSALGIA